MTLDLSSVVLAGTRTCYFDSGTGRDDVIVLLHAFPVGVQMWEPQRNAFSGWRVIAPALPGFDGSEPLSNPSIDVWARHVVALLDHLGVARAVFGGVSMGGYLTFGILRQAASRVRAVVLADTRASADSDEARAGRRRMQEKVSREGAGAVAEELVPKLLGATTHAERPEVVAAVRRMIERQRPDAISGAAQAMMDRPDSEPLLRALEAPTLIVVGEEDTLTPPADAERMHAFVRGSTLVRIPGAGHLSNIENREAFSGAVSAFLGTTAA